MAPKLGDLVRLAKRPWLWFVVAGAGAAVLGLAALLMRAPLWVLFTLLPAFGLLFDPSPADLTTRIFQYSILFGASFLLYGLAGWFVAHAIQDLDAWRGDPSDRS